MSKQQQSLPTDEVPVEKPGGTYDVEDRDVGPILLCSVGEASTRLRTRCHQRAGAPNQPTRQ